VFVCRLVFRDSRRSFYPTSAAPQVEFCGLIRKRQEQNFAVKTGKPLTSPGKKTSCFNLARMI